MFPSFSNADTLRDPFGAFSPFYPTALMRDVVALMPHGATQAFADVHKLQLDLYRTTLTLWLLPLSMVHDAPDPEIAAPAAEAPVPAEAAPAAAPAVATAVTAAIPAPAPAVGVMTLQSEPDDLERINGVGPKLKRTLNSLGIWHFRQIAALSPEETAALNEKIGFKGRIEREGWKAQASRLAKAAQPPQAA